MIRLRGGSEIRMGGGFADRSSGIRPTTYVHENTNLQAKSDSSIAIAFTG